MAAMAQASFSDAQVIKFVRIRNVEGLDEKERPMNKTAMSKAVRSRSPTLRKTETQDIYRTFVDLPEG